jgi:hypothetical protein
MAKYQFIGSKQSYDTTAAIILVGQDGTPTTLHLGEIAEVPQEDVDALSHYFILKKVKEPKEQIPALEGPKNTEPATAPTITRKVVK